MFMNDLDYSELSEAEKEMIFSKELSLNRVGRALKQNVEKFLGVLNEKRLL